MQRSTSLPFSSASIIADGQWRRYSVTVTHSGSDVSPQLVYFLSNVGTLNSDFADPQINVGAAPTFYCHTGPELLMHPRNSYHINTANGPITAYLFDFTATTDDWLHIKDVGRQTNVNPIVVSIFGTVYIEGLLSNIDMDVPGAAITLVRRFFSGWVLA